MRGSGFRAFLAPRSRRVVAATVVTLALGGGLLVSSPAKALDVGNPTIAAATTGTPTAINISSGTFKVGTVSFDLSGGKIQFALSANDTSKYSAAGTNLNLSNAGATVGSAAAPANASWSFPNATQSVTIPGITGTTTISLQPTLNDAWFTRMLGGIQAQNSYAGIGFGLVVKLVNSAGGIAATCNLGTISAFGNSNGNAGINSMVPAPFFSSAAAGGSPMDSSGKATAAVVTYANPNASPAAFWPNPYVVPAATATASGNTVGCGSQAIANSINSYFGGLPYNAAIGDASMTFTVTPNPSIAATAVQTTTPANGLVSVGYPVTFNGANSTSSATDNGTTARACNGNVAGPCTTTRGIGLFSFDPGDGTGANGVLEAGAASDATHLADAETGPGATYLIAGAAAAITTTTTSTIPDCVTTHANTTVTPAQGGVDPKWGAPATVATVYTYGSCTTSGTNTSRVETKKVTVTRADNTSYNTPTCPAPSGTPAVTTYCAVGTPNAAATSFTNGIQPWQVGYNTYGQQFHGTYPVPPQKTHAYAAAGVYTATLAVTDTDGDKGKPTSSTITVVDLPTVSGATPSTDEDTPVSFGVTGSGPAGHEALTYATTAPGHGTTSVSGSTVTYTPSANFNGTDTFQVIGTDDVPGGSNAATVVVTVRPVNDAPTISATSATGDEDAPLAITVPVSDVDADALSLSVDPNNGPAHGSLTVSGNTFTYTPATNYNGGDTFTAIVDDGNGGTASAPVTVTIRPVNDAPVVDNQSFQGRQNEPLDFTVVASDVEGDHLSYSAGTTEHGGTISGTGPSFTYTPAQDFYGLDHADLTVSDGTDSSVAQLTFGVLKGHAPVASAQSVATDEDTPLSGTLNATDEDGDPLVFTVQNNPQHGTLSLDGGNFSYSPASNYNGTDSFSYQVSDGNGGVGTATVSIRINAVNDPPVANRQSVATDEDNSLTITLAATDVDGDPLTYQATSSVLHGVLSGSGPNRVYTPAANYHGPDSFTFSADDGHGGVSTAVISITVNSVNDAPVATDQSVTTPEDTPITINLGSDVDTEDTLHYVMSPSPAHGTLSNFTNTSVLYSPAANYNGADTFSFTVSDGNGGTAHAKVTLNVTPVNDPPVVSDQAYTLQEDGAAQAFKIFAFDVDGDVVTLTNYTMPPHGTLTGSGLNRSYKSVLNFNGTDAYQFKADDGHGGVAIGTVTFTVTPVNDAPVAQPQSVTLLESTSKVITLVATDVDQADPTGDPLTYTISTPPAHGQLTNPSADGSTLTYTPTGEYFGSDFFSFTAHDRAGATSVAQVQLSITHVRKATTLQASSAALHGANAGQVSATLTRTSNGLKLAGKKITFSAGANTICTATTNSQGVAKCGGSAWTLVLPLTQRSYQADFAGDSDYLASSGTGALVG